MPIVNRVADLHDDIKAWRRDFHAHPELLYDVHRTAASVADKLKSFGCDEVVTGTTSRHIYVIGERANGFALVHDYDLSSVLTPNEEFTSQIPDSRGLLWFTARQDGVVGTLKGDAHMRTGSPCPRLLGSGR